MLSNKVAHLISHLRFINGHNIAKVDGGLSMYGCYGELQAFIRSKDPDAPCTHCIIHRKALASKDLSPPLNLFLECVVNFKKGRPLKPEFQKKNTTVYLDCVPWKILFCTFKLPQQLYTYLEEIKHEYA